MAKKLKISQKVIFPPNAPTISIDIESTILTFLPDNLVCFYTKNAQKINFPQIAITFFIKLQL